MRGHGNGEHAGQGTSATERFASLERVMGSGMYKVIHSQHRLPAEVLLFSGEQFPTCSDITARPDCNEPVYFECQDSNPSTAILIEEYESQTPAEQRLFRQFLKRTPEYYRRRALTERLLPDRVTETLGRMFLSAIVLAFFGALGYVVLHFLLKYW